MHGDCQRFNAIYKHLTRKSGESDADLVENAKTSYMERYGNKRFQYDHAWNILKNYPKWNVAEPIDEDNLNELFGPDPKARSTGGSLSESISGAISQDYRRKCEAAYEAKSVKELGLLECRELEFLMIDTSPLPLEKADYIERKLAEIMRKYPNT
uniref:No apical meristem-associated C-terminal domain-containing protein n=1 Tax=Tanacetum cinerariifolium TaxID=118510 RepID=A0A699I9V5_TANCI|nr:hypothetical protein [Tanacetum cinerariifolium]